MEQFLRYQTDSRESFQPSTTYHGIMRTMERMGVTEKQTHRIISRAWERGVAINDLPLKQRRFLQKRDGRFETGSTQFRVYRECIFIFSPEGVLITVYDTDFRFHGKNIYDGKVRVRNPHQYNRMYHQGGYDIAS